MFFKIKLLIYLISEMPSLRPRVLLSGDISDPAATQKSRCVCWRWDPHMCIGSSSAWWETVVKRMRRESELEEGVHRECKRPTR